MAATLVVGARRLHEGSQADRLMLMNSLSSSQDGGNEVAVALAVGA